MEDEMVGWHHWLNGHEFEHPPGVGDGQGGRECCSPWSCKELDTTERLNWTATLNLVLSYNECWEEKLKNAFLYETLQHSYTEKIVVILVKPESVVEKFQRIQQPFTEHLVLVTQWCLTLWPHEPPARLLHPWKSPGKNTRVGSCSLLQGIFPTHGSNSGLLHCRWILYCLSHQRSTRKLEWVALSFSRGFSQPRNWTGIFCTVGRFFTSWATWKLVSNSMLAG